MSVHFTKRSSICEGRNLLHYPARYKCPSENMLLKLRTNAENMNIEPELLPIPAHSTYHFAFKKLFPKSKVIYK